MACNVAAAGRRPRLSSESRIPSRSATTFSERASRAPTSKAASTYRVFADRLDELPDDQRLQLTGVKVDYRPADETAWCDIRCHRELRERRVAARSRGRRRGAQRADGRLGALDVRSEALQFSPDTSKAESRTPSKIRIGDWRFDAGGLRMDLKGETLELESVHGTLLP